MTLDAIHFELDTGCLFFFLPAGGEPSNWDRSDHRNVAFAYAAFGFHLLFNLVFMCVLYAVIYFIMRLRLGSKVRVSYGYDYAYSAVGSLDRGDMELDKPLLNGRRWEDDLSKKSPAV